MASARRALLIALGIAMCAADPAAAGSSFCATGDRESAVGFSFGSKDELRLALFAWCNETRRAEVGNTCGPIERWNVSQIKDMADLFNSFICEVSDLAEDGFKKGSCVEDLNMKSCNPPIGDWTVNQATDMKLMFNSVPAFNRDLSRWVVSRVTSMERMFLHNHAFNQNITTWNVGRVTSMKEMFQNSAFNGDISRWDVSQVTDMSGMFLHNHAFNQNISGWDICAVTDMTDMFMGADNISQTLCWDTSGVHTDNMFYIRGQGERQSGGKLTEDASSVCPCDGAWKKTLQKWLPYILLAAAGVLVLVLVTVRVDLEDKPPLSMLEPTKAVLANATGLDGSQFSWSTGGRRSSSSSVAQIHCVSQTEAYTAIQALSTTSSSTLTQMLVQQLQATNHAGPMPTMVTIVIQQVSDAGDGGSGSESESITLLIAVSVAVSLLLVAALVVGALAYLWKTSKKMPGAANQDAAQPESPDVVSGVEINCNPMHTKE